MKRKNVLPSGSKLGLDSAVGSSIMLSGKKISSHYFFVLLVFSITIIAGMVTISNLYAGSREQSIELSQGICLTEEGDEHRSGDKYYYIRIPGSK